MSLENCNCATCRRYRNERDAKTATVSGSPGLTGYVWCAGWYATKLHAVPVAKHCGTDTKYAEMKSVCGAYVYKEARTPWAESKIKKGVARCKHCERMLNT